MQYYLSSQPFYHNWLLFMLCHNNMIVHFRSVVNLITNVQYNYKLNSGFLTFTCLYKIVTLSFSKAFYIFIHHILPLFLCPIFLFFSIQFWVTCFPHTDKWKTADGGSGKGLSVVPLQEPRTVSMMCVIPQDRSKKHVAPQRRYQFTCGFVCV